MKSIGRFLGIVAVLFVLLWFLRHKSTLRQLPEPIEEQVAGPVPTVKLPQARDSVWPVPMVTPTTEMISSKPLYDGTILDRFMVLNEKVLLSREEQLEKEKLLSSSELLRQSEGILLSTNASDFSRKGHKTRFNALYFMERALEWESNPSKHEIVKKIEKLIEAPTISATLSSEIKRSIAGDKMELYTMLSKVAPGKAANILSRSRGTPLEKILQYTKMRFSF